jgi:hypothetical protein
MITLANLPQASAQEVFDQVKNHLLKQGGRSVDAEKCRYRSSNGMKCAAGCLIGDKEYDAAIEYCSWDFLVFYKFFAPDSHNELISDLQKVHDNVTVPEWEEALKKVAQKYGLIYG